MIRLVALAASLVALAACETVETGPPPVAPATIVSVEAAAPVEPGIGDRLNTGRKFGTRSAVVAPNAAAATAHPLATQVALDIMKRGGSAMDAAIAANAMLGLVEPTGNGIGGDLFAIVWDPRTQKLYGYNGSGRSPIGATLEDMQAAADAHMEGEEIPPFGAAPVSVPGTVEAWGVLHERFGRMPLNYVLEPTIDYARGGAPIPEVIAYYWGRNETRLREASESGMLEEFANAEATFFSPAPVEGALFTNPDLADTLERIAEFGPGDFYTGQIARTMDAYFERIGGFLTYEDFAAHEGEWVEPFCADYREARVCQLGPNTQGVAALQMLQMLEGFPMREFGFGSADSVMAQVEAKRLAFADRASGYADPAFSGKDPARFISNGYNQRRARFIDLQQAMSGETVVTSIGETLDVMINEALDGIESEYPVMVDIIRRGRSGEDVSKELEAYNARRAEADAKLHDGDTTYLSVADSNGMMVSLIQSNYRGMGSGLVADGLGFMFQDRGQLFSLDPAHPNVFEPGKRPFHTIIPGFAFKDVDGAHQPWLSFGLMGGGMQPQGHVQVILNLIDYDMGLQEAGDAARWEHVGGCEPTDDLEGDDCEADMGEVRLESGLAGIAAALESRGHEVRCCGPNFGGYQAVMRDFESGAWIAATEMRKDGAAGGY
ncbi:MAG: gamma-glutamyltransferase family protein [Pseudomonadota bacterium]